MIDVDWDTRLDEADVRHIVRHLRQRDRAELFALRWDDDEDSLAMNIYAIAGPMWRLWRYRDEPVAMSGVCPQRPGVVSVAALGTDRFSRVVRPIVRWGRDWVIPRLATGGIHRVEGYALASNIDGHRLMTLFGMSREAWLYAYGRDREDFVIYTRRF